MSSFDEWFQRATGNFPFSYQRRFGEEGKIPQLVDVPTGLRKTGDGGVEVAAAHCGESQEYRRDPSVCGTWSVLS